MGGGRGFAAPPPQNPWTGLAGNACFSNDVNGFPLLPHFSKRGFRRRGTKVLRRGGGKMVNLASSAGPVSYPFSGGWG